MKLLKILYVQLFICLLLFITLTALRVFDSDRFIGFSEIYSSYAYYDTDISLVYNGNQN